MEWHDYLQRATDVAEPYLDRAIEAMNAAQRGLDRRRRKIKRRIGPLSVQTRSGGGRQCGAGPCSTGVFGIGDAELSVRRSGRLSRRKGEKNHAAD